jgi:acyl carrier protein
MVCAFNREKEMNIEHEVKKIVSDQLGIDIELITNDKHFINDLGGDSLDTVEMLLYLEDKFKIEVPDEVAEEIHTVQMAIDLVKELKQAA